ncbi:protein transport protein Yos1p [[Candida] anglica]|uniref:Protein transport protein Yos1p n=1 Tax=[Candida] anglica TaxID=148631 RepID=A0ABP0EB57_9ASCO
MFGLGKLLYVVLLTVNGLAVLSEDRFLNRIGWGSSSPAASNQHYSQFSGMQSTNGGDASIKSRLINLIGAVRTLMRLPLICVNVVVILYELVLG